MGELTPRQTYIQGTKKQTKTLSSKQILKTEEQITQIIFLKLVKSKYQNWVSQYPERKLIYHFSKHRWKNSK